jgi:hypothetical protein
VRRRGTAPRWYSCAMRCDGTVVQCEGIVRLCNAKALRFGVRQRQGSVSSAGPGEGKAV